MLWGEWIRRNQTERGSKLGLGGDAERRQQCAAWRFENRFAFGAGVLPVADAQLSTLCTTLRSSLPFPLARWRWPTAL